ncbi:MAG: membrane protein insertion efficiency factor YidD [Vicinamibacterales bacterium]
MRRLLVTGTLVVLAAVFPLAVPAHARVTLAIDSLELYHAYASPVLSHTGIRCRFTPTCSRYAELAIKKYGAGKGSWLTLKRLLRCTPLTPMGTSDPP